jgi:hypothetical protein
MIKKFIGSAFKPEIIQYFFSIVFISTIVILGIFLPQINDQYNLIAYQSKGGSDFVVNTKFGVQSNFFNNSNNNFEFSNSDRSIKLFSDVINIKNAHFQSFIFDKGFIGLNVLTGPYYYSNSQSNYSLIGYIYPNSTFDYFIKTTLIITSNEIFNNFLAYYSINNSFNDQNFIYLQNRDNPKFISTNNSLKIKTNYIDSSLHVNFVNNLIFPINIFDYQKRQDRAFLPSLISDNPNTEYLLTSFDSFKNFMFSKENISLFVSSTNFEFQLHFKFDKEKNLPFLLTNTNELMHLITSNTENFIKNEVRNVFSNPYELIPTFSSSSKSLIDYKISGISESLTITTNMIFLTYFLILFGSFYFFRSTLQEIKTNRKFEIVLQFLHRTGFQSDKFIKEYSNLLLYCIPVSFTLLELFFVFLNSINIIYLDQQIFYLVLIVNSLLSFGYYLINYFYIEKNIKIISYDFEFKILRFNEMKFKIYFYYLLVIIILISYFFINIAFLTYDLGLYFVSPGFFDLFSFLIIGIPNLIIILLVLTNYQKFVSYIVYITLKITKFFNKKYKLFSFFVLSCIRSPKFNRTIGLELILFCSLFFIPLYFYQFQTLIIQTDNKTETGSDLNIKIPFNDRESMNSATNNILTTLNETDIIFSPYVVFNILLSSEFNVYPLTAIAIDYSYIDVIAQDEFKIYYNSESIDNNSLFFSILKYEQLTREFPNYNLQVYFGVNSISENISWKYYHNNGFYLNFPKLDSSYSGSLSSMVMNLDNYLNLINEEAIESEIIETGYFIWLKNDHIAYDYKIIESNLNKNNFQYDFSENISGKLLFQREQFKNDLLFLSISLSSIIFFIFIFIYFHNTGAIIDSIYEINRGFYEQGFKEKTLISFNFAVSTIISLQLIFFANILAFGFNYAWETILKLFLPSINSRLWEYKLIIISNENLIINFVLFMILSVISILRIINPINNLKNDI